MSANLSAIAYLIAAICFIMALKGLSSPTSARRYWNFWRRRPAKPFSIWVAAMAS